MLLKAAVYSFTEMKTTVKAIGLRTKNNSHHGKLFQLAGLYILASDNQVFSGWVAKRRFANYFIKDVAITANNQRPVSTPPNIKNYFSNPAEPDL